MARAGLSPLRTLALARDELAAGDAIALDRLAWVLSVGSSTAVWPEVVHPRTGGGSAGAGHHAATGAAVLTFVRDLLVRETGSADASGLAVCSALPDGWRGQGIEVHEAPTDLGSFSFGLRWHGPRPALLWELDPHPGVDDLQLAAPGLDPTWRGSGLRGEALLAAPAGPEPMIEPEPVTDGLIGPDGSSGPVAPADGEQVSPVADVTDRAGPDPADPGSSFS